MAERGRLMVPAWGAFLATREEYVWAGITTLAAILLLLSGGYRRLEKITTVLVAAVTLFTVVSVVILQWTQFRITLPDLERGLRRWSFPAAALALAFSAFGITGVGASELVAYPYWCIEKGYARCAGPRSDDEGWARRARGWIRVMQLDAWFSMVVFTVATVAFYLLGAAVLHPQGLDPKGSEMIPTLSQMYLQPLEGTPLAGLRSLTRVGFLLGAWAVLFKTLYVATAANSRLTADFLDLVGLWRPSGPAARERVIRLFCVIYPTPGARALLRLPRAPGTDQGRRHRPGAHAAPDRRGDPLPPRPRRRPPRRPRFPDRHVHLARLLRHHRGRRLQRLRPVPGASRVGHQGDNVTMRA